MRQLLAGRALGENGAEVVVPTPEARSDRVGRLLEAQRAIAAAGTDPDAVFQVVCEQTQALTGAESSGIWVLDGDGFVARATGFAAELGPWRVPLEGTIPGLVHRTNKPVLIHDFATDPLSERLTSHARRLGIRSNIIVPLRKGSEPVGQLHLFSRRPDAFTEDDLETVELLSVFLALALSQAAETEAVAQLQTVYGKTPVGMLVFGPRGVVLQANSAIEQIFGYSEAELRGRFTLDFTHSDDVAITEEAGAQLSAGLIEYFTLEKRYVRKDGSTVWATTTAVRVADAPNGEMRGMSFIEDITERKVAELALRKTSQRLEQIVNTQRDIAVAGHNVSQILQMIVERSQALTGADGASVNLLEGEEIVVVNATGALVPWIGMIQQVGATASLHALKTRQSFLAADAPTDPRLNRKLVEAMGSRSVICVPLFQGERPIGTLIVMSTSETEPLTEDDRQALELLCVVLSAAIGREAEFDALARFQTVYDSAPLGMLIVERGGRVVDVNRAFRDLLGYSVEELQELRHLDDLIHPEDLPQTRELRRGMIEGRTPGFQVERRYIRKDGSAVWTESSVSYVYGPDGEATFAMTMVQDISKRQAAEEQLRQAQKIEAIGQLTAGIAHDFNNLLMGVLGYAALLRSEAEEGTRNADYLDRIEQTGRRAASLTQQLLAFGRQQSLKLRRVDLNELVGETVAMLGRVLGEHIEIDVQRSAQLAPARADPTQIQQVLFNLALNARDAMPKGGKLRIATRNVEPSNAWLPATLAPTSAGFVQLTVSDTGRGMTSEVLERIFEPFFTTKEVGEGSGLGLASVYGIVKQSGGEIQAESEVGAGTTFRIYLPAV